MNLKKIYNCVMSVCVPCLYEYKRDVVLSGARKGNLEFFMGRERRGGGNPSIIAKLSLLCWSHDFAWSNQLWIWSRLS